LGTSGPSSQGKVKVDEEAAKEFADEGKRTERGKTEI